MSVLKKNHSELFLCEELLQATQCFKPKMDKVFDIEGKMALIVSRFREP